MVERFFISLMPFLEQSALLPPKQNQFVFVFWYHVRAEDRSVSKNPDIIDASNILRELSLELRQRSFTAP